MQLAKSLISFSTGNMKPLHENFQYLKCNIDIINGSEDNKYIKYGRLMLQLNKKAKQYIIEDSSHNTHLENQELFINTMNNI